MTRDVLFNDIMAVVLEHEGFDRISDHPADPGGVTKWGVSLRFLQKLNEVGPDGFAAGDMDKDGDIDADDIRGLTKDQALTVYWSQFWNRYGYGNLQDRIIATKVMDLSVNMGPAWAHTLLQRSAHAVVQSPMVEDGVLGPKTMAYANSGALGIIVALRSEAAGRYRLLAEVNPKNKVFLNGWLARAYS